MRTTQLFLMKLQQESNGVHMSSLESEVEVKREGGEFYGWNGTHSFQMEWSHSIPAGKEWSFHSCWNGIITFPLEWHGHSISAGMECHSRPSLKKYADWEDPNKEHQSQYYPHWPIFRYPKKYEVRNVTDCDFCDKAFNKHRDFTHGVFSVGCACAANITYGY